MADRTPSEEGKRERIATARDDAHNVIGDLRADVEKTAAAEHSSLELRLLAPPSSLLGANRGRQNRPLPRRPNCWLRDSLVMTSGSSLARATIVVVGGGHREVVDGWCRVSAQQNLAMIDSCP